MGDSEEARVSKITRQDDTMMDVGDKDQPPGDPPDRGDEWVRRVKGFMTGGRLTPEAIMGEDFVAERLRLEFPEGAGGEPEITIEEEVLQVMNGLWKQCLIVRVLGRSVSIPVLNRKLREMWKPKGGMSVVDLPRQFFMIRFELEDEYVAALTGGPWRMFGSLLLVKGWMPEFNPMSDEITTTPVWVRLLSLPANFYHKGILMGIARGLGNPVKVDTTTLHFERARFARVCVEIDLSQKLQGSVKVNGNRYFVTYEGLSKVCSGCGIYGHLVHNCPMRVEENAAAVVVEERVTTANRSNVRSTSGFTGSQQKKAAVENDGFTVVGRRKSGERPSLAPVVFSAGSSGQNISKNILTGKQISASTDLATVNRFSGLMEDSERSDLGDMVVESEEDKENNDYSNQIDKEISGTFKPGRQVGLGVDKAKGGPRGVGRNRKGGNKKVNDASGPKSQMNTVKPARGSAFGPPHSEVELSTSGKRLRVEQSDIGRPGGAFLGDNGGRDRIISQLEKSANEEEIRKSDVEGLEVCQSLVMYEDRPVDTSAGSVEA